MELVRIRVNIPEPLSAALDDYLDAHPERTAGMVMSMALERFLSREAQREG